VIVSRTSGEAAPRPRTAHRHIRQITLWDQGELARSAAWECLENANSGGTNALLNFYRVAVQSPTRIEVDGMRPSHDY
jgi:hypothetical protein